MTARRTLTAAAFCMGALLLGGCGKLGLEGENAWTPQGEDAISVASDGSVTEIIQETLDQSYYSADELNSVITSSVAEYNQTNGENSVEVKRFETKDSAVTLELSYASAADYAQFNNTELFFGSIINAQLEGYLFDGSFYQVKDGKVSGTATDSSAVFQDNMAAEVLIVQAPLEVHVDGEVTFITTNAQMISSDTVNATGEQEDESEGLVLPSSAVYKQSDSASFEEQKEANRVYIIYE